MKKQKTYSPAFKLKVAIEALKARETIAQLALRYDISARLIRSWKQSILTDGEKVFERKSKAQKTAQGSLEDSLRQQIAELEMKINWLKRKGLLK